jgi:hypothetical protein
MPNYLRCVAVRDDDLRELTTLAHTVAGVTLRLFCCSGAELLVSANCLGADLDPCRLRATLLQEGARARLAAGIDRAELVAGLRPLGAGLYERTGASAERWFVTALAPSTIVTVLTGDPSRPPHEAFHTVVKPDPELGLHAVCVGAVPGTEDAELDEAAVWALGRVLVAELAAQLHHPAVAPDARPQLPRPIVDRHPRNHPQQEDHP